MTRFPALSRALGVVACVLLLFTGVVGCARGEEDPWLMRAADANDQADHLLGLGRTADAVEVLRQAEAALTTSSSADAHLVRRDLLYRLAEIELGAGNTKAAADWATRGLSLGRPLDVFTTNLLIVRGRAFEHMNDPSAAARDYHEALVMTESLLDRSLEGKSP